MFSDEPRRSSVPIRESVVGPANGREAMLDAGVNVIRRVPLNGETPPAALATSVTPTANVYVRTNFGVPPLDARSHRVHVTGAAASPLSFGVDDLAALEQTTVLATMECAGNDRTAITPPVDGEPWTGGAISTVRWSGVPLRTLLDRAGVDARATDVLFEGADHGHVESIGRTASFARSLPLRDAMHRDTLLATHMNGEPLPPRYGAPIRLVVPGWFGMASVKWLQRIEILTTPFDGYFQTQRYVYDEGQGATPVTRMRVKSLIATPIAGSSIQPGMTRISGWAWSGDGAITAVDVSAGADSPDWRPARLHPAESPTAWVRWEIDLEIRHPGTCVLRSRARDAAGNVQPERAVWNTLGYGNNAVRITHVHVAGTG